jgi:hypothetical protein
MDTKIKFFQIQIVVQILRKKKNKNKNYDLTFPNLITI